MSKLSYSELGIKFPFQKSIWTHSNVVVVADAASDGLNEGNFNASQSQFTEHSLEKIFWALN